MQGQTADLGIILLVKKPDDGFYPVVRAIRLQQRGYGEQLWALFFKWLLMGCSD